MWSLLVCNWQGADFGPINNDKAIIRCLVRSLAWLQLEPPAITLIRSIRLRLELDFPDGVFIANHFWPPEVGFDHVIEVVKLRNVFPQRNGPGGHSHLLEELRNRILLLAVQSFLLSQFGLLLGNLSILLSQFGLLLSNHIFSLI